MSPSSSMPCARAEIFAPPSHPLHRPRRIVQADQVTPRVRRTPEGIVRVSQLMQTDVQKVRRDDLLPAVVEALADQHVTALAVVDNQEHLVGVVSIADLLTAQAEMPDGAAGWQTLAVEDVMTAPALTIAPDATAAEAARQLLYADVHRLFVEDAGALVGVISQTDLVQAFAARRLLE